MQTTESPSEQDETTAISFQDIVDDAEILERLTHLGFTTPTDVQARAVPPAMEGKDVVAQAQTGSGKTLAFSIPLIKRLKEDSPEKSQTFALLIAPTRELALQIQNVITSLSDDLQPVLVIGGADEQKQRSSLDRDARIVVGTPGRLLDMLRRKVLKLRNCRYFVLDEADEMLSMGFIEDVRAILAKLPKRRQGMFVSATITPRVDMLANSFLRKAEQIVVDDYATDSPPIEHLYCEVSGDLMAKPLALCDIIETQRPRSAIIFCNTKSDTQLVEVLLRRRGFDARRINSDLTQSQRERVIKKIRAEELQLLVATDIAARGLDIEQIDLVINYAIHDQPESYIHRTGRTGRAGRAGRAISLVGPRDFGAFHFLQKVVEFDFQKVSLPTDEEVADARLAHLYEMLREKELDIEKRMHIVAQKFIKDNGGLENPPEELVEMLATVCQFTVEHFVHQESKSLDEELQAAGSSEQGERKRRKDHDNDNDRRRDRKRSGKDGRKDRSRSDSEGRSRGRDSRSKSDNDSRGRNRERRGKSDDRRGRDRDRDRGGRGRGNKRSDSDGPDPADRLRLYIGQGTSHGMNEKLFSELAEEFADVSRDDLQRVSIREHYGYVDTSREQADALMKNVSGIEYNGHPLPMKVAAVFQNRPPRSGRRSRSGHTNEE